MAVAPRGAARLGPRRRLRHRARGHRARPARLRGARHRVEPSMLDTARAKAPEFEWVLGDLSSAELPDSRFDLAVAAGNVMIFLELGTEAAVVSNLARTVVPGGLVVAGFQVGRQLTLERYDAWAPPPGSSSCTAGRRGNGPPTPAGTTRCRSIAGAMDRDGAGAPAAAARCTTPSRPCPSSWGDGRVRARARTPPSSPSATARRSPCRTWASPSSPTRSAPGASTTAAPCTPRPATGAAPLADPRRAGRGPSHRPGGGERGPPHGDVASCCRRGRCRARRAPRR